MGETVPELERLARSNVRIDTDTTYMPQSIVVGTQLVGDKPVNVIGPGTKKGFLKYLKVDGNGAEYQARDGMKQTGIGVTEVLIGDHVFSLHQQKKTLPKGIGYTEVPMDQYINRLCELSQTNPFQGK